MKQIANTFHLSNSTIDESLKRLMKEEFISRRKANRHGNGRSMYIYYIKRKGKEMMINFYQKRLGYIAILIKEFANQEFDKFRSLNFRLMTIGDEFQADNFAK